MVNTRQTPDIIRNSQGSDDALSQTMTAGLHNDPDAKAIYLESLRAEEKRKAELHQLNIQHMQEMHQAKLHPTTTALTGGQSDTGEDSPHVIAASAFLTGIPRVHLASILDGKFDPYNLHKLRARQADEDNADTQKLSITDAGGLQLSKARGKTKDFGNTSEIWIQGVTNYQSAVIALFGTSRPHLGAHLNVFFLQILRIARVYKWKEAALQIALTHHSEAMAKGQTIADNWKLPQYLTDEYCNPTNILPAKSAASTSASASTRGGATSSKKRKSDAPPPKHCYNFNDGNCKDTNCPRPHKCMKCKGDHPVSACTK